MIELLILGIILFIVGVAGTFVYDKYKAEKLKREEYLKSSPPRPMGTIKRPRSTPKSTQDLDEDLLSQFAQHMKNKSASKTKVKSNIQAQEIKKMPTEDIQKILRQIQEMKKKL